MTDPTPTRERAHRRRHPGTTGLAPRRHHLPVRADGLPVRVDARAVRRDVAPDPGDQVRRGHGPVRGVRVPAAGGHLDLRRRVGGPAGPQEADHRRGRHHRGRHPRARDVHGGRCHRPVADLRRHRHPLGRRRDPDARRRGPAPADRPRGQADAGQRHQRHHPVGHDARRAGRRRRGLRQHVDRRGVLHRRRHRGHRHRPAAAGHRPAVVRSESEGPATSTTWSAA